MTQEQKYIQRQKYLLYNLDLINRVDINKIKLVAGVDSAYWKVGKTEYAVCCIVVIDYQTKEVIEKVYNTDIITVPYIPGCLAFREMPLFLKTRSMLRSTPDLFMFDGNGYLHPRHIGLATHAGILLNIPSIGVAKTYFKINNTDYIEPENKKFAHTNIVINNEVYGRALRTQINVKPIFVSTGNKIDLDTATQITSNLIDKESHIPVPTRLADIMTHQKRKEIKELM